MDKMIVVVFDNEAKAYLGSRALKELRDEGSIAIYAGAVIAKDASGKVSIKEGVGGGAPGTALGMATGALIGLLGGPAGVVLGAASGALGGSVWDISNAGIRGDFVEQVSKFLLPGRSAVVAEIEETWITPLDTRMEALGGLIFRAPRAEVIDLQMEREAAAHRSTINDLKTEISQARGEAKTKLQAKADAVKASVQEFSASAKARMGEIQNEADAKIKQLKDQSAKVQGEAKTKIDERIREIQADYQARSSKLNQAWQLTKDALSP